MCTTLLDNITMGCSLYLFSESLSLLRCFLNYQHNNPYFKINVISNCICDKKNDNNKEIVVVIDSIKCNDELFRFLNKKMKEKKDIYLLCTNSVIAGSNKLISMQEHFKSFLILNAPLDIIVFSKWFQNLSLSGCYQHYHKRKEINRMLSQLNIPIHLNGHYYLSCAIAIKIEDKGLKLYEIYDKIARENHTTSSRVERAMRIAMQKIDCDKVNMLLGLSTKRMNMHLFILQVANHFSQ